MRVAGLGEHAFLKRMLRFRVVTYTARGWLRRADLKAMEAMGLRFWNQDTGELIGGGLC